MFHTGLPSSCSQGCGDFTHRLLSRAFSPLRNGGCSLPQDKAFWKTLKISMLEFGTSEPFLLSDSAFNKLKKYMASLLIAYLLYLHSDLAVKDGEKQTLKITACLSGLQCGCLHL